MRSNRVYQALRVVPNRFMLCNLTFHAARRFHHSSTSVGQTINVVLDHIAHSTPEETKEEEAAISSKRDEYCRTTLCA